MTPRTARTARTARTSAARGLVVSLALATAVLSGCGSDEETSADAPAEEATTAPEVSDEDFVAAANEVCVDGYVAINDASALVDPADPTTVTDFFYPTVQDLQDQLNALTPSEGLADGFAEAMDLQQQQLDVITADPAALFELDPSGTNAAFDALGMTACGSGSGEVL